MLISTHVTHERTGRMETLSLIAKFSSVHVCRHSHWYRVPNFKKIMQTPFGDISVGCRSQPTANNVANIIVGDLVTNLLDYSAVSRFFAKSRAQDESIAPALLMPTSNE